MHRFIVEIVTVGIGESTGATSLRTIVLQSLFICSSLSLFVLSASAQRTPCQPNVAVFEFRDGKVVRLCPVDVPRQGKMPWEFTLAERLTARLDPARILERQRASRQFGTQATPFVPEDARNHGFDGAQHPELLLPHELFGGLMDAFAPDETSRMRRRASFQAAIRASGWNENLFWSQLASAATQYAEYLYADARGGGRYSSRRGRDPDQGCRLAFHALTAARQIFGAEKFDQFLYEHVAPGMQLAWATNMTDPAAELRRVAAGCQ